MPFAQAKCTNCGANLEVDNTKDAAICPYCKTPYVVEKAINNYNTANYTTNNISANTVNLYTENSKDFIIRAGVLEKYNGSDVNVEIPNTVKIIGSRAFEGCIGLESVVIPSSVSVVSGFWGCVNLKSVKLPDGVSEIGKLAFCNCHNLCEISIPYGVNIIGNEAFSHCNKLANIDIPDSVTQIGSAAFEHCEGLNEISIPNGVTKINSMTFCKCSGLISITIPNSVITIGNSAFSGCTSLTAINIPNSVTTIEDYAFNGCTELTSIVFPRGVVQLGSSTVMGCTKLEAISLARNYGYGYFSGIQTLKSITFLQGIKEVDMIMFKGCKNIERIAFPDSIERINNETHNKIGNTIETEFYVNNVENIIASSAVISKNRQAIQSLTGNEKDIRKANADGCYVATAVYGSYDCPEVWILRRYRDYTLAKTWYGRLLILIYYAISPTLVRWFGNTKWFKNMLKTKIDTKVEKLLKKGFENTPYSDKNWRKRN